MTKVDLFSDDSGYKVVITQCNRGHLCLAVILGITTQDEVYRGTTVNRYPRVVTYQLLKREEITNVSNPGWFRGLTGHIGIEIPYNDNVIVKVDGSLNVI